MAETEKYEIEICLLEIQIKICVAGLRPYLTRGVANIKTLFFTGRKTITHVGTPYSAKPIHISRTVKLLKF